MFRLQSEIAEQVTPALDVALRAPERAALATAGTRNPEAYDFYLRGNDYLGRSNQRGRPRRTRPASTEQAVDADPGVRRGARQARPGATPRSTGTTTTAREARLGLARAGARRRACGSRPTCPRPTWRWGSTTTGASSTTTARSASSRPRCRLQPSNSELLQAIGYVERRRGRWEESLGRFVEALRYDPRSGVRNFDVGDNYFSLRMYPEADRYLDRAMTLSPDWANPYIYRAWLQVIWRGDTGRGHGRCIAQGLARIEPGRFAAVASRPATGSRPRWSRPTPASGPCSTALSLATFTGDTVRYHLLKAEAAALPARPPRPSGPTATRPGWYSSPGCGAAPTTPSCSRPLALAYSHLGRHAEAIRAGERAASSCRSSTTRSPGRSS